MTFSIVFTQLERLWSGFLLRFLLCLSSSYHKHLREPCSIVAPISQYEQNLEWMSHLSRPEQRRQRRLCLVRFSRQCKPSAVTLPVLRFPRRNLECPDISNYTVSPRRYQGISPLFCAEEQAQLYPVVSTGIDEAVFCPLLLKVSFQEARKQPQVL